MIISDLNYLEITSEATDLEGGATLDTTTAFVSLLDVFANQTTAGPNGATSTSAALSDFRLAFGNTNITLP